MKQKLLALGVGAALLAGLATIASAEPYYRPAYPEGQRSGVSILLSVPFFGQVAYGARPGGRDYAWQRDHGWQRGQGDRDGHDNYHGHGQYGHGNRGF